MIKFCSTLHFSLPIYVPIIFKAYTLAKLFFIFPTSINSQGLQLFNKACRLKFPNATTASTCTPNHFQFYWTFIFIGSNQLEER